MSLATLYLGNPASPFGMQAISPPPPGTSAPGGSSASSVASGVGASLSRATTVAGLISGGVATLRKPKLKSTYQVGWGLLGMTDVELLTSFFDGRQGGGPYCLVDPSWNNFFPPNVAGMGSVLGAVPEWGPSAGTLATSTAAGPAGLLSGVAQWTSAVTGSILYAGFNNVVDGTWLPPVVTGVAHRVSLFAKLVSGTATLTAAAMYGVGGSAPAGTAATGTGVVLSTSVWQEVAVGVANNFSWAATADYVLPKWTVSSATTPVILLSAAAFVYDLALTSPGVASGATASALNPWVGGVGVPRVLIASDIATPVDLIGLREYSLTLQES